MCSSLGIAPLKARPAPAPEAPAVLSSLADTKVWGLVRSDYPGQDSIKAARSARGGMAAAARTKRTAAAKAAGVGAAAAEDVAAEDAF